MIAQPVGFEAKQVQMKVLLAAILGSIAMFIWTSVSAHMALPLGEAGIGEIPNESPVLNAMQSNIGEQTGLYIFPGLGVGKKRYSTGKERGDETHGGKIGGESFGHSHVSRAGASV